ncbi:MAG: diguanylate cyclase domain-containing protein [Sphingomonadales bacterium]
MMDLIPAPGKRSKHDRRAARLDAEGLVEAYPGPALLLGSDGKVLKSNAPAWFLVDAFERDEVPALTELAAQCLSSGTPFSGKISLAIEKVDRQFQGVVLCGLKGNSYPPFVVLLARETTFENNLTHALVESRQRFKDLVNCSSDFAWETDATGALCFVSRDGALGYPLADLNGMAPERLLHPDYPKPAASPFTTNHPQEDTEVWLRRQDGEAACVLVSAVPITDGCGRLFGSRGVCRDVTEQRRLDAALGAAKKREKTLNQIVSAMREVVNPIDILPLAAQQTARATGSSHCRLWRLKNGTPQPGATHFAGSEDQAAGSEDPDQVFAAVRGHLETAADQTGDDGMVRLSTARHRFLLALSRHRRSKNGVICLARDVKNEDWSETDRELLAGVANQLGVVMEQIERHEELEGLSRVDPLTGLLNKSSFGAEIGNRILHQKRSGEKAALLFVDLDNFKQVNDSHGHLCGDNVLRRFGEILTTGTRPLDIAARVGGDEFALWLENADEQVAADTARRLHEAGKQLRQLAGAVEPPLSLSIGIAISDPEHPRDLDQLVETADRAMYQAKAERKAGYEFASKQLRTSA